MLKWHACLCDEIRYEILKTSCNRLGHCTDHIPYEIHTEMLVNMQCANEYETKNTHTHDILRGRCFWDWQHSRLNCFKLHRNQGSGGIEGYSSLLLIKWYRRVVYILFAICDNFRVQVQAVIRWDSWVRFEPDTSLFCTSWKYISHRLKILIIHHWYHVANV